MEQLRTELQLERERRDNALYADYQRMTSVAGVAKTAVNNALMKKYNIHSPATIYTICNRVEAKRKEARHEVD